MPQEVATKEAKEAEQGKLSRKEIKEFEDLYNRIELQKPDEIEEFKGEFTSFISQHEVTEENIEKLSFFINKLDEQERKFFIETLKKMPMAESGFSNVPGLHEFESVFALYDRLIKSGRIVE